MMSAPRLDHIFGLVVQLDHEMKTGQSLSAALESVLNAALGCLPSARFARVYRFVNQTAALEAATDGAASSTAPYTADTVLHYDTDKELWVVPLFDGALVFGVMEVNTTASSNGTGDWLQLLGYHLARAIATRGPSELATETLNEISQLVSRIRMIEDEQTLLDETCQGVVQLLHVDHASVTLLSPSKKQGVIVSEFPGQIMIGTSIEVETDPTYAAMINSLEPLVINDVQSSPLFSDAVRKVLNMQGVNASMLLPLAGSDSSLVGALGMGRSSGEFSPIMIGIAQLIAAQLAVGLQELRAAKDRNRGANQLRHISQFGQMIQAETTLDTILETTLTEANEVIDLTRMNIVLAEPDSGLLGTVARHHDGQNFLMSNQPQPVDMDHSLAASVWKNGEIQYIPEILETTALEMGESLADMRSVLGIPIQTRGRMLGVVTIGSREPHAYNQTDLFVMELMLNQLAIMIDNATVYARSQRLVRNEALVNEISANLQRQLDVESMLNVTVNELGKALGARRARIRLDMSKDRDNGVNGE
ncbi:MAG: GAF domain-containing protein [Anaerolineae bacterium]|nr:GAF domain-containing protein [Anaerolineae bacterium]